MPSFDAFPAPQSTAPVATPAAGGFRETEIDKTVIVQPVNEPPVAQPTEPSEPAETEDDSE